VRALLVLRYAMPELLKAEDEAFTQHIRVLVNEDKKTP
jgi:hypothetical protein